MNEKEYLDKAKSIVEYVANETREKALDFNVFNTLNVSDKEVMMCRMLYEFLNSQGKHGKGYMYLKGFMENVLELDDVTDDELSEAKVYREYVINGTDRRIDIYIDTPYRVIPVEVKIYAEEQKRQCFDYFIFSKAENENKSVHKKWRLVYLTLYGDMPSNYSTGNDKNCISSIKRISWRESILGWMEKIRDSQKNNTNVYEVVSQYIDIIMDITGQKKGMVYGMMMDEGLLNSKENMKAAQAISDSFAARKAEFIEDLFERVRRKAKKEVFSDSDSEKVYMDPWNNRGLIKSFYHFQKSSLPALNYYMKSFMVADDSSEYQLWLRFEIDSRPFVSFIIVKKCSDKSGNITYTGEFEKTEEIYKAAENLISIGEGQIFHRSGWWVDWFYIPTFDTEIDDSQPNFKSCNEAYYDLYEAENIEKFVEQAINGLKIMKERVRTDI